ncbi:uncharacterized protein [Montipora foliosa]|uniref:uncharacterized protein n=1 Tax=Montipora foliosa TaxID=591990 RepID=UPI0035F10A14
MDCRLCNVCRRLSKISLLVAFVMAFLELSPMRVSSVRLPEEDCRPRPTVVLVKEFYKPHHIKLFQCAGTCKGLTPSQKPCIAVTKQKINLEVTSLTSNKQTTVVVHNHTQCGCKCNLDCQEQEIPDDKNCKCQRAPGFLETRTGPSKSVDVLPYQIGIAVVGFFALCVLIIEMIMCGKDKGLMYKVTEKCCKSDKTNNTDVTMKNGKYSSTKENHSPTEV